MIKQCFYFKVFIIKSNKFNNVHSSALIYQVILHICFLFLRNFKFLDSKSVREGILINLQMVLVSFITILKFYIFRDELKLFFVYDYIERNIFERFPIKL